MSGARMGVGTLFVGCLLAMTARVGGQSAISGVTFRDSSGVVVITAHIDSLPRLPWTVGTSSRRIAGDREPFFQVAGMTQSSAPRLVVGDAGMPALRTFDATGRAAGTWGRAGEGPGEFRSITSLGSGAGDSVWVHDMVLARLTLFDAEGRPTSTIPMPPTTGAFGEVLGVRGPTIIGVSLPAIHGGTADGLRRDSIEIYPVGRSGGRGQRVAVVPGRDQLVRIRRTEQGVVVSKSALPFGYEPLHAISGPFVVVGGTETYDLTLYTLDGAVRTRVRVDVPSIPVRGDLLRSWARIEAGDDGRDASRIEERADAMPLHDWAPEVTAIAPERDGGFWVRRLVRPGEGSAEWVAHSTEGRPLGLVRVPAAWEIREVGRDYLLALERGRDGEELVIVASLER